MNRLDAIRRIVPLLGDAAVVSNLGRNTYDLYEAADRPENFYMWGAMGSTSSVGLGIAMAQPGRRVVVLDGDGSMLMSLGCLATVAAYRPANLTLVVLDNETYETTGGQATHSGRCADLEAIARGAGLAHTATVTTVDEFAAALGRALRDPGPWFILAKVEQATSFARVPRRPIYIKDRFMAALGTAPG
jgi:thiamine pyrophosphate-dependent acetolactate synthase large subunit-like protein